MQGLRTETLEGREVTPRSGLLPQRMAAAVAVLGAVLPLPAQADAEAASGQKVARHRLLQLTARAEVVMVVHRQA